jgi:hypothetical protein
MAINSKSLPWMRLIVGLLQGLALVTLAVIRSEAELRSA